jgi:hypothetical protein
MNLPVGNRLSISVEQSPDRGGAWTVRLFKRSFFFKKRISSDWFLDEQQATTFAKELGKAVRLGYTRESMVLRKPGWTLERAP